MAHLTREIARESSRPYFDDLSRELGTVEATVEVEGADLGAQVEADRLLLTGLSYDDRDDILVVGLDAPGGTREDLEHLIHAPRRVLVDTAEGILPTAIDIQDADGYHTLVQLQRPPALPPE